MRNIDEKLRPGRCCQGYGDSSEATPHIGGRAVVVALSGRRVVQRVGVLCFFAPAHSFGLPLASQGCGPGEASVCVPYKPVRRRQNVGQPRLGRCGVSNACVAHIVRGRSRMALSGLLRFSVRRESYRRRELFSLDALFPSLALERGSDLSRSMAKAHLAGTHAMPAALTPIGTACDCD